MTSSSSPLERILSQWPIVDKIREKCGVGSISVGVLHQGEVLFTGSTGYRDVDEEEKPDMHTLYTLCSISKTFVAAAMGILVDRGKCAWTDPVGPYLPEFKAKDDPRVATEATFYEFLRYSGGLANPVVTILGPEGKVLVPERDFINLLNDTPTGRASFGPYYNATWEYSNVAYGLMALVIERLSGKRFADFVSEEILKPLGMNDTAVYKSQVASHSNMARSFVRLSDGLWCKQPEHEWTDDRNTPVLAMVGIRSSVNDLLIWCAAAMDAQRGDGDASHPLAALSGVGTNPLREMRSILDDEYMYWTRPHNDDLQNPCNYHLSWLECVMPSSMIHWGSWNKTLADKGHAPQEQINSQILGRDSPKQTLYKCAGVGFCGLGSINLFPDSMSAIVVMSSGLNAADPSDFTAALLMQELFDLKGRVEIMPMVCREVDVRLADWERIMVDWRADRDVSRPEHPPEVYTGKYEGLGIILEVRQRQRQGGGLEVVFNGREDITQALERYNEDTYTYQPTSRDDWLRGGWLDWDYYMVSVLRFHRDDANGPVTSVTWTWERGCDPAIFKKIEA
ncbi:beta-lactamase/transpeptidase-like protein [Chaetomium fimeti]|uniref:Beta-lactamase/transpeptidase-like protein n=1 Tax=Chaetomium fimeti TaxID=1854472 RepID=A0AAE0LV26_9PEZI|nr:beta-lactamase/transpeptidase-like protein [Chaetomium fimeti]